MIQNIISQIANTPGSNDKIAILASHKNNEVLKKVCWYTYNPTLNFYTKQMIDESEYSKENTNGDTIESAFPVLDKLIAREITGGAANAAIKEVASNMTLFDRMVLNKIIDRDLACGISIKSIKKVWPDLIPETPYMRCSGKEKTANITYPAIIQQKCDGMFVNAVYKDGEIEYITRSGSKFKAKTLSNELINNIERWEDEKYEELTLRPFVIHGELLVKGKEGSVESRKTGNGLINSMIKLDETIQTLEKKFNASKTQKQREKIFAEMELKKQQAEETERNLIFIAWDTVYYDEWLAGIDDRRYDDRLFFLQYFTTSERIRLVENKIVNSYEEAIEFFNDQLNRGYEGAVLKNLHFPWKNHTSPDQIKLKAERECDLICVGWKYGTGDIKEGIGTLICESADGMIQVGIGYGLSMEERGLERVDKENSSLGWKKIEDFDLNKYVGRIITVKFNEVIKAEGKATWSLFLPAFIEDRDDKTEADSFDKIKKL